MTGRGIKEAFVVSALMAALVLGGSILLGNGCNDEQPSVNLYTDVDKAVVEPLAKQYQQERHVVVNVTYADPKDIQSGKGLSEKLLNDSGSQTADVYWAVGPAAMERMRAADLLEAHQSDITIQTGAMFRGEKSAWSGVGARTRVILYNTKKLNRANAPKSFACLALPQWKGRCALADPRTNGNANYQVAMLFDLLSLEEGRSLLEAMKTNAVQFAADEPAVIDAVASGKADWGVTDSDLALTAINDHKPVDFVVCDQETYSTQDALHKPHESIPTAGTPLLPFAAGMLKNRPHVREGYNMMDFLTSQRVAGRLADLKSNWIPTHEDLIAALKDAKDPKGTHPSDPHILDPSKLSSIVDYASVEQKRAETQATISSVLGDAPH